MVAIPSYQDQRRIEECRGCAGRWLLMLIVITNQLCACFFVTNDRFAFSCRVARRLILLMSSLLYMNIDVFCEVIKYLDPIQVLVTMSPLSLLSDSSRSSIERNSKSVLSE